MLFQNLQVFFLPWNTKGDVTALLHKNESGWRPGAIKLQRERENTTTAQYQSIQHVF